MVSMVLIDIHGAQNRFVDRKENWLKSGNIKINGHSCQRVRNRGQYLLMLNGAEFEVQRNGVVDGDMLYTWQQEQV